MPKSIRTSDVKEIIFVCEAGVGSSLMSVNSLKKKLKQAKVDDVTVTHLATARLASDAKFVVCHKMIVKAAQRRAPDAVIVGFNLFFNDPVFDKIVKAFVDGAEITGDV
jgi:mannitol-specific phosphotransferase system IIBC component